MQASKWTVPVLMLSLLVPSAVRADDGTPRLGYNPNVFDNSSVDRSQVEGWVDAIDVRAGVLGIIDPRGFHARVPVKPWTIGEYRMNDHLRIKMRWDGRVAETVERLD